MEIGRVGTCLRAVNDKRYHGFVAGNGISGLRANDNHRKENQVFKNLGYEPILTGTSGGSATPRLPNARNQSTNTHALLLCPL